MVCLKVLNLKIPRVFHACFLCYSINKAYQDRSGTDFLTYFNICNSLIVKPLYLQKFFLELKQYYVCWCKVSLSLQLHNNRDKIYCVGFFVKIHTSNPVFIPKQLSNGRGIFLFIFDTINTKSLNLLSSKKLNWLLRFDFQNLLCTKSYTSRSIFDINITY